MLTLKDLEFLKAECCLDCVVSNGNVEIANEDGKGATVVVDPTVHTKNDVVNILQQNSLI